jgi:GNAT superfamily N-acetyltransferase
VQHDVVRAQMAYRATLWQVREMSLTPDDLLERSQWDFFWVPSDAVVVDRPELLYVSCSRDPHLNMVTRVRASAERLPALVDEVITAHRDTRSCWLVLSHRGPAPLEAQLSSAGYAPEHVHDAYTISPESYEKRSASAVVVERVDSMQRLQDSETVGREAFGKRGSSETDTARLQLALETCSGPNARVIRFVAYDAASGQPISAGGLNVYPNLHFGFLWGGGTVPDARGRGAYSAVVARRMDFARQRGLSLVGLYARIDTSAPIVAKQGFQRHGRMVYWERVARE